MKERSFDEMVAYFNRRVSEMDIAQDYKMELLGMVTALGYKHEKTAQQWIPCSERLPDKSGTYICNCVESDINHVTFIKWQSRYKRWDLNGRRTFWRVTAWKPIPEPYERRQDEQTD